MFEVHEYDDLATNFWIPTHYWKKLHIIPDDSGNLGFKRDPDKPLVVLEHGLHDSTQTYYRTGKMYSQLYADYYLCATKESYDNLVKLGKECYYTGSTIVDFSLPETKWCSSLVYVPSHGVRIDPEKPPEENNVQYKSEPLTFDELKKLTLDNGCREFYTSVVNDDVRAYHHPCYSNRYDNASHLAKMRYLLSVAKCVYENPLSTFGVIAQNLGIPVIGTDEKRTTPVDGMSRKRILEAMNDIISKT